MYTAYNIPGNHNRRHKNASIQNDCVNPCCFHNTAAGGHIMAIIIPTTRSLALVMARVM